MSHEPDERATTGRWGSGLSAYLNDHLAGSVAALQLVRRRRDREGDSELGRTLARLAAEIEEDRAKLERVMDEVGVARNPAKQLGARGADLLMRVKQTLPAVGVGSPAVALLEELELLSLGIEGKALLWQALGTVASTVRELAGFDFDALKTRARSQRALLEPFRRDAAIRASSG
jgi:hypothetical protein